jgi:thiamine biosynthesis lipoprotein
MRALLSSVILTLATSCATLNQPDLQRFTSSRTEMGMEFRITLYAPDQATATLAANAAFDRIQQLNAIFSDYEDDSELTALSRSSGNHRPQPLSPELFDILNQAQKLSTLSSGAFDVTVGPYTSLWRRARRQKEFPREDLLNLAHTRVGYEKLHLNPANHTAILPVERMRLDLGGIAKGYAMDEAIQTLRNHGIHSALVSGGGDLKTSDAPPGSHGWRIALTPTEINGQRYSHIVNPHTGLGLTNHALITVVADRSVTADSLSTTLSVLPPKDGLMLLNHYPNSQARIAYLQGTNTIILNSRGFNQLLSPESPR